MGSVTKTGHMSGSDMLLCVGGTWNPTTQKVNGGRIAGHCQTCDIDITNTYQDVQSKPTDPADKGLHPRKRLVRQSITVSVKGLHWYDETDNGLQFFLDHAISGESFIASFLERRDTDATPQSAYTPFFTGRVVVEDAPTSFAVGRVVTYTAEMVCDGQPYILNASNLHYHN